MDNGFGKTRAPGEPDELGAPMRCRACGAIDSVHLTLCYLDDGKVEVTVECWECGELYDTDRAVETLSVLGEVV